MEKILATIKIELDNCVSPDKNSEQREHARGEHSDDQSDTEPCNCKEQMSSISWLKGLAIKKSSIVPRGELWVNKEQYDE